jgi:hypothetical protein
VKLKWTRKTATYWVADCDMDIRIKKWRHRESGNWYYTIFVVHADTHWSAGKDTLADAKNAAQVLADAVGKGE